LRLIFAKITPCMENGKGAIATGLKEGYAAGSTEFIVLRPNTDIIQREWLYLFLAQKSFRLYCQQHTTGSAGQKRVPPKFLSACEMPIPSLEKQHKIVSRIEELSSNLDEAVRTLQETKQQLAVYRQAVLKEAFIGKLTVKWRESTLPVNADEIIARIKVDYKTVGTHKMMEALDLPVIPNTWRWVSIGDISTGVEYGTSKKSMKSGDVPVLRMGNIQNSSIDWTDLVYTSDQDEIHKYMLHYGDVLFNRTNSSEWVGKTAPFMDKRKALFAGYLIRINQISEINPKYLAFYLNSETARKYGNKVKTDGVNQSNINSKKLYSYPFPLCSRQEQDMIVNKLENRLSVCNSIEKIVDDSLVQAEALRQSILKKAFEGRLV